MWFGRLATAVGGARADDALLAFNREAQRLEQRLQHGVGLETVPAAAAVQDALYQGVWLQALRLAQLGGDVLIRHARDEGPVHGCAARRRRRPALP
jgi:hypothetical protein